MTPEQEHRIKTILEVDVYAEDEFGLVELLEAAYTALNAKRAEVQAWRSLHSDDIADKLEEHKQCLSPEEQRVLALENEQYRKDVVRLDAKNRELHADVVRYRKALCNVS